MPTGRPNMGKLVNFRLKVLDPKTKTYKPCYTAPDATDVVYGDVLLTDEFEYEPQNEKYNCAATGVVAVTPKALKRVNDNAETKLSKTDTNPQEVAGPVTFLDGVKASDIKGVLALENIPKAAVERIVNYESIDAAKAAYQAAIDAEAEPPFQIGDTVRILGNGEDDSKAIMYAVIDDPTQTESYVEYAAATATNALAADKLNTDAGSLTQPVYFVNGVPVATSYQLNRTLKADDCTIFKGKKGTQAAHDGYVPAPTTDIVTDGNFFLKADGTWAKVVTATGMNIMASDLENTAATIVDDTAQSPTIISGSSSTTVRTLGTVNADDLPLGFYSVILRMQCSNITNTNAFLRVTVQSVSNTNAVVTLKTVDIKPSYFAATNTWECLSFGVNYTSSTKNSKLRITLATVSNSTSFTYKVDYLTIMQSGTALGSIA